MSIMKRIIVDEMKRLVPEATYANTDWRSWYFSGKLYQDMFRDPIFLALFRDRKKLAISRNIIHKLSTINSEYYSKQIDLDDISDMCRKALKDMEDVE